MLSKVSNRVRRRPTNRDGPTEPATQMVTIAPDLLRWSDFLNPFPPVASGGYTRYYAIRAPEDANARTPEYCPLLSHYPESSSSSAPREILITSKPSLFNFPPPLPPASLPQNRSLSIIHEASMESMIPIKLSNSSASELSTPLSLRRKRRQLLRTPSIERDFANISRHLFSSSTTSLNEVSSIAVHTPSSSFSRYSDHSRRSGSSGSDSTDLSVESNDSGISNHFDIYPITPATSVDSGNDEDYGNILVLRDTGQFDVSAECAKILKAEVSPQRPDSRSSFSTARSEFSDA